MLKHGNGALSRDGDRQGPGDDVIGGALGIVVRGRAVGEEKAL